MRISKTANRYLRRKARKYRAKAQNAQWGMEIFLDNRKEFAKHSQRHANYSLLSGVFRGVSRLF